MLDTMPRRTPVDEPTVPITLRVPRSLLERLRRIAHQQDRSVNAQIVRELRQAVERGHDGAKP
jgi:hypothetical protein